MVADDKFQISTLELSSIGTEAPPPPTITSQESVKARANDVWAGLVPVEKYGLSKPPDVLMLTISTAGRFLPLRLGCSRSIKLQEVARLFAPSHHPLHVLLRPLSHLINSPWGVKRLTFLSGMSKELSRLLLTHQ